MSAQRRTSPLWTRSTARIAFAAWLALGAGCTNSGKVSEENAVQHVQRLAKLADEDVDEVRRGVPRGAKNLGALWEGKSDPRNSHSAVRRKLEQTRAEDRDLMVAKSTFFALTDDQGVVLCSDQEPDLLSGKGLLASFPDLRKALGGENVELVGNMVELSAKPNTTDNQWLVGAAVRDPGGAVRGAYVSGWSYKRFAYHLEETLKHDLVTAALQAKKERAKQPLVYVFVFTGPKVYGAPLTPQVNAQELEKLDLPGKTASGVHRQQVEVTGRAYGLAATRAANLGPTAGVVVLRSET